MCAAAFFLIRRRILIKRSSRNALIMTKVVTAIDSVGQGSAPPPFFV